MSKVLIFGAGSVGSIYAYVAFKAGADVTAICRSNYSAVKERGFTINSTAFGQGLSVRPSVVRSPSEAAGDDWDFILVCSKAFPGSSPSTAELIKPAVTPKSTIVLVQNGVAIEDEYAAAFPQNSILSCVAYLPVTQTSPGVIEMGSIELLEVGTFPAAAPASAKDAASGFAALLHAGGAHATLYDDIQPRRWSKLLINASWNPICALARCDDAAFRQSSPDALDFVRRVMLEVVDVAQALGYEEITAAQAEKQIARAKARTVGIEPSMLADVKNGQPMEVEAIVGNVVRNAREKGVQVPRLEALYFLATALNQSLQSLKRSQLSLANQPLN